MDIHSGTYVSFEAEFKTWSAPEGDIDTESSVYAAAEIFRFLRDMALDIPPTQSRSLLLGSEKEASSSRGAVQPPLVHPGAVLCMVNLLPGINIDYSSPAPVSGPARKPLESPAELSLPEALVEEDREMEEDALSAKEAEVEGVIIHLPSGELSLRSDTPDSQEASMLFPTSTADAAILLHAARRVSPSRAEADVLESCDSGEEQEGAGNSQATTESRDWLCVPGDESGNGVLEECGPAPKDIEKVRICVLDVP